MKEKLSYSQLEQKYNELLQQNQTQFLLDDSEVIFVQLDTNGIVSHANKKACKVLGYENHEIVGKNWFETFLPNRVRAEVIPISKKIFSGELKSTEYFENPVLTKSGEERLIYWHNAILRDSKGEIIGLLSSGEDVTIARELELKQKERYEKRATIFNAFNDGVYICSADYDVLYMNPAMIKIVGRDAAGEKCHKAIFDNDTPCENSYFNELRNKGKANVESKLGDKYFNVSSVLLDNGEKLTVYHDITKFNEIKAALESQNKELIVAKDTAEQSDALKTEFMNNMSHEIRTPLNGILGFTDFLQDPDLAEDTRNYYVNIIKNSGNQLLRIIEDILEISELGTEQAKLQLENVCVNDMLLELFSVLDLKAKENKTPLYFHKSLSDKDSTVKTDPVRLRKILINLIENALKFTRSGFVEYGYDLENENFVFYVKDTGIGIDTSHHDSIFERFSQAEKGLSKKVGGLGLGLSIAKENAKLLEGEISVESSLGNGSKFYVKLPYKPVFEIEKVASSRAAGDKNDNHYNILVAEDEEINYLYIEILLQEYLEAKCTVYHAKNGQEAVDMCDSIKNLSLVLMDLKMPVMSGYEASKLIRQKFKSIPIIAQTAYSTDSDRDKAIDAGCTDVIVKPINKNEFHATVNEYLLA